MKNLLVMLFCIFAFSDLFATEQAADILLYENNELFLATGWGHPSPLETYFLQNNIDSPFEMLSTGNYRGFIATWKICNNKLYITKIDDTKSEENRLHDIFTDIPPDKDVLAGWFSGVLQVTSERFYSENGDVYYFHIRKGVVRDSVKTNYKELTEISEKISDGEKELTKEEKKIYALASMSQRYIAYYFRLYERDSVRCDGVIGKLIRKKGSSPILSYFHEDDTLWPFNWENERQSGAPNCHWQIENDQLYLTKVTLFSGTAFSGPAVENIPLARLFPNRVKEDRVFAKWISGVFIILNGYDVDEEYYTRFKTTGIILLGIVKGKVAERYNLSGDFKLNNPPEDCPREIKELLGRW